MSIEIGATIAKYGVLAVAAALVPPFVYGAMAMALGVSDNLLAQLIQGLTAMALIIYFTEHGGVKNGIMAALGLGAGIVTASVVKDMGFSALATAFGWIPQTILNYIINGFLLGLGVGFFITLSTVLAFLTPLIGALLTGLLIVALRLSGLIMEALEGGVSALIKYLSEGYKALLAPYMGTLFVAIPISVTLIMVGYLVAMTVGIVVGIIIAGLIYTFITLGFFSTTAVLSIAGFAFGALIIFFLRPFGLRGDAMDIVFDFFALLIAPYLAPALYTAGYGLLLSRLTVRHGLYLIGLAVLFSITVSAPSAIWDYITHLFGG